MLCHGIYTRGVREMMWPYCPCTPWGRDDVIVINCKSYNKWIASKYQIQILLDFLLQMSTICFEFFVRQSLWRFYGNLHEMRKVIITQTIPQSDFIIYIWENSTDTVPTGMVRQTFAWLLKLGHIVCSIELVDNCFNCSLMSSLGWLVTYFLKVFHSVDTSGLTNASITKFVT